MRKHALAAAALLGLVAGLRADSVQEQLDALKAQVDYIKQNYERTEPAEAVKAVTEWVSPSGEIFREPQKDNVSPTDGSKLQERVTYRKLKFSRRESVGEKIDAAVGSAINGHVVVGLEMVGSYFNTVGAGDYVDADGTTRSANKGRTEGAIDLNFSGKPMRNTLMFADLDVADGTAKLSEAWVAVNGPKNILSLQAGVIDLTGAFDNNLIANDETSQFISPALVNSSLLANPDNAFGAILRGSYGRYDAAVGAQTTAPGSADNVTDDLYSIAELGFRYHLCGDAHVRVWGRQQPRGMTGGTNIPDQALGLSVDHRLSSKLSTGWRYAKNSYVEDALGAALNVYDWEASGAVEITNYNPRNLKERCGLGYARSNKQDGSYSDVVELYHRVPLTPNFALGWHYQAAFETPAGLGVDGLPAMHTLGLRAQSTF